MALSAEFSVNGDSTVSEHTVAYGATVSLAALSTSFRTIAWEISSGSKSGATAPTITYGGAPLGVTASFTQVSDPGDGLGRAWVVKCTQTDAAGSTAVAYRVVGTLNVSSLLPICADEEKYRDATHGWSQVINQLLATSGGGATGDVHGPGSSTSGDVPSFNGTTGKVLQDSGLAVADVIKRTGAVPFTADQSMGSHKLTNLTNGGTGTQDAASVAQVEALIAASTSNVADWKQSVRAATTANITLSGAQTIDGVSVIAGDRVLVKNQSTGSQNGIYVAASGAWSRATDADASSEVTCGMTVLVEEGTVAGGHPYILTTANPITLNTTALTFTQLSSATADGTSITSSGGTFSRAALTGDVTASAGSNATTIANLAVTNAKIANSTIDLTTKVTGVLPLANGGTGQSSFTKGEMLIYNGTTFDRVGIETGTDFSDASVSIDVTGGYRYTKPAAVTLTVPRTITVNATGASAGDVMWLDFYTCGANQFTVNNGGSGGSTAMSFTTPTSGDYRYAITFDGVDWGTPRRSKLKVN